eukprot:15142132-Alexandrium_andersonii.AAC.1
MPASSAPASFERRRRGGVSRALLHMRAGHERKVAQALGVRRGHARRVCATRPYFVAKTSCV